MRTRQRRRVDSGHHRRPHGGLTGGALERLEPRLFLSATPTTFDAAQEAAGLHPTTHMISWEGREFEAFRDQYLVRMPQTNSATSRGFWDYESVTPQVEPGWSVQSVGGGFYSVGAPGVSQTDVIAWADEQGALSLEPDQVLEKQAVVDETKLPTRVPNDEDYAPLQWGLNNVGGVAPEGTNFPRRPDADIDAPQAWAYLPNGVTGSKEVIVAVFDDGIDHSHPDLQPNMWQRPAELESLDITGFFGFNSAEYLAAAANSQEQLKYFDNRAYGERQFLTQPGTPYGMSVGLGANDSHGTHVAGIIGAKANNTRGVAGVNWNVSLYSANIFRFGRYVNNAWVGAGGVGAVSAFVDAVDRIVTLKEQYGQNFVIANCSFNTYVYHPAMQAAVDALAEANILLVAAAGNGYDPCEVDGVGDNLDGVPCPDGPVYPAAMVPAAPRPDNVIAVAASTAEDKLARFSNWGTSTVDIAAPGENIWSTVPISARRYNPGTTASIHYDSREPFEAPPSPGAFAPIVRPLPYRTIAKPIVESPPSAMGAEGGYASMSGTSMSAAYVSGVAALLAADYLSFTKVLPSVTLLRNAILNGADRLDGQDDKQLLNYIEGDPGDPAVDVMYVRPDDPNPGREHRIAQDRRLNAYWSIDWLRKNMPPSVFLESASTDVKLEGDAGLTSYAFNAVLSGPAVAPLTVFYWTEFVTKGPADRDGNWDPADADDFVTISESAERSFTIAAGVTRVNGVVEVQIRGDEMPEKDERFVVRFRMDPTSQAWLSSTSVNVTIKNDDGGPGTPVVRIDPGPIVVPEGSGGDRRTTTHYVGVAISEPAARTVLVTYRVTTLHVGDGVDATALASSRTRFVPFGGGVERPDFIQQTGRLRIPAFRTEAVIPVRVVGDRLQEEDEYFVVELVSTNTGVLKADARQALVVIEDDDAIPASVPTVSLAGPSGVVTEGADAEFTVNLSAPVPAGWTVTVVYAALSGRGVDGAKARSDFSASRSGRVVLREGETTKTIVVRTLSDRRQEADETFTVRLTRAAYRDGLARRSGRIELDEPREADATIVDGPSLAAARLFAAAGAAEDGRLKRPRGVRFA